MEKLSNVLYRLSDGSLGFWCLGCDMLHRVMVDPAKKPCWGWNQDIEKPTFSPSIKVTWTQWEPSAENEEIAVKIRAGEIIQQPVQKCCHSFVENGQIRYLMDCTHDLKGQTIDLPTVDVHW